jgi:hypothetical protein
MGLVFFLAIVLGTTACSTLNAGNAAVPTTAQPLSISASLPGATVGNSYSAVVSVSGGTPPYIFATSTGQLPPGLSLNSATGVISGMPKVAGSFDFTIAVTDKSNAAEGARRFVVAVKHATAAPPVSVEVSPASVTLAPGATRQFAALVSNASSPAVTWSASAGTVTSMGLFTAPKVSASTTVRLTATSQADPTKIATAAVNVEVTSPPSTAASLALTTASLPAASEGSPYTAALQASGGKTPYQWKVTIGSLPSGFSLAGGLGTIAGITSQPGLFSFTASVTDAAGQVVSRKFAIDVAPPSTGNFDGPAELPRVSVSSTLSDTPAGGVEHLVNTPAALQSALNSAVCGDTISLQAGSTFTGRFVLPAKNCDDNHWIIVRTSAPDSALPPEGTRLTPCYAGVASLPGRPAFSCTSLTNVLAKLSFDSPGSGPIALANGANHYRLLGLEITRNATQAVVYNLVSQNNGAADHIIIDRSWLHGTAQDETTRGVMLAGIANAAIVDSFFSDFHCVARTGTCTDSQAIAGGLGDAAMGPYKILNNYLEAASENILFGGGGATQTPQDVEIRRNFFFKPLIWMKGATGFVGGHDGNPFVVKNLLELKNAQRILIEGNVFDNTWGGFSQVGFALLLTPKNPGGCPTCMVRDITIRYSKLSHAGAAMQIGNSVSATGFAAQEGNHYSIHDLVFDDIYYTGCLACDGFMFQLTTTPNVAVNFWLHDVSIRHVTVASPQAKGGWIIAGPVGQQNFVFEDSIVDSGGIANVNAGGGSTQCYYNKDIIKGVLDSCWSHYRFSNNVVIGSPSLSKSTWPTDNFVVASGSSVGFASWNGGVGGDYHLASSSPYKGKASDGKDPGADIDAVEAATAGVN